MTVITISRSAYGGVEPLADCLASELQYRVYTREELLADAAATFRASESQLHSALQHRPGLLEGRGLTKLHFLYCVQAMLAKAAQADKLVYHGEAGHLLLPGVAHHLRVRAIANLERRLQAIMEDCDLSREKATEYMRKLDEGRRKWAEWVHGVDTDEPSLFDLVVNFERVPLATACAVIVQAARTGFQTTPASQRSLDDLVLLSHLRASIGLEGSLPDERIHVDVKDGVVTISVSARFVGDADRVAEIARSIPGVTAVELHTTPERSSRS